MSATIATFASRTLKSALREASRMSHAATRSTPPPMHGPATAAMTGLRQRSTASKPLCMSPIRSRRRVRSAARFPGATWPMSSGPMALRSSP